MEKECKTFVNGIEFISDFTFSELFENMILISDTNSKTVGQIRIQIGDSNVKLNISMMEINQLPNVDDFIRLTYLNFKETFIKEFDIDLTMYLECGINDIL